MAIASPTMPELYSLSLVIKEFPCRHLIFKDARLLLHRPDTEAREDDYDFRALIRGYDPTDSWSDYPRRYILHDLFNWQEKMAIEAYLATHHLRGLSLTACRQSFPIPNHWAPCNAAGYGNWEGEYMFNEEDGFNCPVRFWGYYWLEETPVVAGLAKVCCEPDGTITMDGLDHPSSLSAKQAAKLCQAWMRAKSIAKPEIFTLRYEWPAHGRSCRSMAHPLLRTREAERLLL